MKNPTPTQTRILGVIRPGETLLIEEIMARLDKPVYVSVVQAIQRLEQAGRLVSVRETLPTVPGKRGVVSRKWISLPR